MNKVLSMFVLSLSICLLSGCLNNNSQKVSELTAPMKSEDDAIEDELESFTSIPVFSVSATDVFNAFENRTGEVNLSEDKDTTTYLDENNNFELYTNNLYDERIDQFYTTFYVSNLDKVQDYELESYRVIFDLIDISLDKDEFVKILKSVDVKKDRKDKINSYSEDIKIIEYNSIWLAIEGIYTSNSSKEPAYIEVRIYPEEPSDL